MTGRGWWRWRRRFCAPGIRRGPEPADRLGSRLGPGARRSRHSFSWGIWWTMRTRPHLERSESRQLVAQHGMDVEAPATSPQQEMVGPAAKTPRHARSPANLGVPSAGHAQHPPLAGACQHIPADLFGWHHERTSLCGGPSCWARCPLSSFPDDWTKPPSQPGQGSSGPGAPGPADSTGLPGRPTALISRQRRQTNTDRRLTEEVQQDVQPGPQSPGASPEPSAGGLNHGATTARTGGGRVLDACGELYLASGRKLQRGRR